MVKKNFRTFGGKKYHYTGTVGQHKTKGAAKKTAQRQRKKGYNTRVVKHKSGYTLYTRY